MYIIKVKDKDEYIKHGYGKLTKNLNEARTFTKTNGANNAINNVKVWFNYTNNEYEVVEVEIKIK